MNFTPTYGWYYIDANHKSPSWTGVPFFYNFMTRADETPGPIAVGAELEMVQPGDVVQLSFDGENWNHTPVVIQVLKPEPDGIFLAAHSYDALQRPLSSYNYIDVRLIHFTGVLHK